MFFPWNVGWRAFLFRHSGANNRSRNISQSCRIAFIERLIQGLTAVLLSNGNQKPSIPVTYAIGMKETWKHGQNSHCNAMWPVQVRWKIQRGLHQIVFVCGTARPQQNTMNGQTSLNMTFSLLVRNVAHMLLITLRYCFRQLHIKLGLMKNLVKDMDKSRPVILHLKQTFLPQLSNAKLKEGIFTDPQIQQTNGWSCFYWEA